MKILFYLSFLAGLIFPQELHLKKGMQAPDFTLEDQDGKFHTLSRYMGISPVVIYFYPRAGTSGCTKQACGIRDSYNRFDEINVPVFGISTDSREEIIEFVNENKLNFPLLSDNTKEVSKKYGVLRPGGVSSRYTFIIDKEGQISDIIEVKDIDGHSEQVIKKLESQHLFKE